MLARHCLVFLRDMSNETRGLARHDRVLAAVVGDQSFDRPCLTPLVGPCARSGEAEFSRGVGPRAVHPGAPLPEPWPGCGLHRRRLRAATKPFRLPTRPAPTKVPLLPEAKDLFGHACRMSHRAATQCSCRSDFLSDFRCMRGDDLAEYPPAPASAPLSQGPADGDGRPSARRRLRWARLTHQDQQVDQGAGERRQCH
jgi:hypothetical protein